jgi:hypothetical protein
MRLVGEDPRPLATFSLGDATTTLRTGRARILGVSAFAILTAVLLCMTYLPGPAVAVACLACAVVMLQWLRPGERRGALVVDEGHVRLGGEPLVARKKLRDGQVRPQAARTALERGTQSSVEWLRNVRALPGRTSYRAAGVSPETLWRIVEDPALPSRDRAAAAAALGPTFDDEARARIRVLAEATVSPRLRVALEAAGEQEDTLAPLLDAVDVDDALEQAERKRNA